MQGLRAAQSLQGLTHRPMFFWPLLVVFYVLCCSFFTLSMAQPAADIAKSANLPDRFEASGRFGLRVEQTERSLHLQGLFEVKTDQQSAKVELFDPAGQRLLLWRQDLGGEALIETARDGPSSTALVQQWLYRQGIRIEIEQLDAWRWRRWLELEQGRFRQGSFVIERSPKKLVIEQAQGSKLRLIIVPSEKLKSE
ncbi:MAG: hypothetical protein EBT99_01830 [Betaproteobacteria bacterium]|nr:hypothetical protein [Pseudomonadota bacterium]NBQ77396.1 hypothetical protein [Betaproteobacteria bacterium]NDA92107.1 hypothetical protein [Betaproteobacteria bacterium]